MPGWLIIIMQLMNLVGTSSMVGLAAYGQMAGQPGAKEAGVVAGLGAAVQQLRDNPLSKATIDAKKAAETAKAS